jgi:hypothetical protein
MLRNIFSHRSTPTIPPTYLSARDVLFILGCHAGEGQTETRKLKNEWGQATCSFRNQVDGRMFEMELVADLDGAEYKTQVLAEFLGGDVLDIKSIVFDNEPERLRNPEEIYCVLNYIGNKVSAFYPSVTGFPFPHENKGELSKLGRFLMRIMPNPKRRIHSTRSVRTAIREGS